ncbi:MAG: SAM-dependent methyltransferase [Actinomycetia bacterium]|nr:SAM-dependent methyltransferase [Actinomycetes bacterium]
MYGQEVNLTTAAIARTNLFFHEIEDVGGIPPAGSGDYAWVQHMVASMNPDTGRIGAAMAAAILTEADVRRGGA